MWLLPLTGDVDAVSGLHLVHQVVVGVHHRGVGGLAGRHVLRRLLDLNLERFKIKARIRKKQNVAQPS